MPNDDKIENDGAGSKGQSDLVLNHSRLPKWNKREPVSDNWCRGIALTEAWFDCLTDIARRQYAIEDSDNRRASIRSEIHFLIADALFDGRLIAIGSAGSEAAGPVLTRLDAFLFRPRVCKIDWQEGSVESLGKRYSDVHIVAVGLNETYHSPAPPYVQLQSEIASKRGRKSLSPLLAEATRRVAALDPLFPGRIQEKQILDIQVAAKALAPGQFTGSAKPGRSTVARFVQAQRARSWPCLSDPANPENPE